MIRAPKEVFEKFPAPCDGPLITEQAKSEIMIGCTNQITQTIDLLRDSLAVSSEKNSILSRQIFWLNIVLTAATVVGALAALLSFCFD